MRRYRVLLPVEIDGHIHGFGSVIELGLELAKDYSHALMLVEEAVVAEEEATRGGNS